LIPYSSDLLRNSFKYAGRQHRDAIAKALKPVCTAPTEQRFLEFAGTWGDRYPAIVRLRENAWAEFVPFLAFDAGIRKVVCSTTRSRTPGSAGPCRPERAGRTEMRLPRGDGPGPDRHRPPPLGDPPETRPQRLRRTPHRRTRLNRDYAVIPTDPRGPDSGDVFCWTEGSGMVWPMRRRRTARGL
jgi:hypothetical protein